ncbi:MAG: HNH endonuclease [Oscillochloris sp.]|nr:HNH endonuclease [Oscillochloris sp.]
MSQVLILNASYEPLHLVSLARAVRLLVVGKAEILEATGRLLRFAQGAMPEPLVLRLFAYVAYRRRVHRPAISRGRVFTRDQDTCQYCGAMPGRARLTLDHVLPRAQGGQTSWENVVTCCGPCNSRKADRTPEQAGMTLRSIPRQPAFLRGYGDDLDRHVAWARYGFGS